MRGLINLILYISIIGLIIVIPKLIRHGRVKKARNSLMIAFTKDIDVLKKAWFVNQDREMIIGNMVKEEINQPYFGTDFKQVRQFLNRNGDADPEKVINYFNDVYQNLNDLFNDYNSQVLNAIRKGINKAQDSTDIYRAIKIYLEFMDEAYHIYKTDFYNGIVATTLDARINGSKMTNIQEQLEQFKRDMEAITNEVKAKVNRYWGYGRETNFYENQTYDIRWQDYMFSNFANMSQEEFEQLLHSYKQKAIDEVTVAYETLEITETSTDDEVRKAYKRLAIKYHPDKNKSADAAEMMTKVNAAYTLIKETRGM